VPSFRTGTVVELLVERPGLQRVTVDLGDPEPARAYALTDLTGPVGVGDRVVLNTTAVELGLGTGGWHVVHWNLARETWSQPGGGHIMKLRYTSLQADTGAGEEQHPDVPDRIDGTPVVVCTVHSQVPCVVVACAASRPDARVVYVMTDGAALPLALSDLTAAMCDTGLLAGTVTAGHAFGGDLEAVGVPSALTLARHALAADVIVVGMGPGVVGTGTGLGTTALEAAAALDTAAALGGKPVLCLRVSSGDQRDRHHGVSHHARTVLDLVRSPVTIAAHPELGRQPRHHVIDVDTPDTAGLLAAAGLSVTTMGRRPDQDPAYFAAAGAAGAVAAWLLG
jgi:Protein of unknown function (DUF3866)